MSGRTRQSTCYVVLVVLMGVLRASASLLGGPMSEDDVMKLWNVDSQNTVTAADLRNANHPANEWMIKLKSSFAGVMEAVCDWEKRPDMKQSVRQPTLMQAVSQSMRARNVQAAEVQAFVSDYERFRSSSGNQICSHSKQFLNGVDVITVGTTNITALKEFEYRMGSFVAYTERNLPVKMLQDNAGLWGLDRIDQQDLPYDNNFAPAGDGAGVHVYIIDTGINTAHTEYAGRIGNGYDFVDNNDNPEDCNGHGTHCAGTALGSTYGVARAATLHGVRVLSCSGGGTWAGVIGGMNWVAENHISPAVASMSLGGGFSQAINDAVATMHAAGVVTTTAAGNSNRDACSHSPASAEKSFTVNSMTSSDARSSFSNYGACTNIFAPGSGILSAWIGSATASNTISGTSMATPHVAGVMAVYLGLNPTASPDAVWEALESAAAVNKISDAQSGTPNLLVQAVGFCNRDTTPGPHEDCVLSEWSEWSACTIGAADTCEGTRSRTRTVVTEATGCGTCPSNLQETAPCFNPQCTTPEPAQLFPSSAVPTALTSVLLAPHASGSNMSVVCQETVATLPYDPAGHTALPAEDDGSFQRTFPTGQHFNFFGSVYQDMYVGTNGYITFGEGDSTYSSSVAAFFSKPRIGAMMTDLNPTAGGSVRLGFEEGRAVVTWAEVPYYGSGLTVTVQVEIIFSTDEVRITYGAVGATSNKLSGVSSGSGVPPAFSELYELIGEDTEACAAPPSSSPTTASPTASPTSAPTASPTTTAPTPSPTTPSPTDGTTASPTNTPTASPTDDDPAPPVDTPTPSVRELMHDWLEEGLALFGDNPQAPEEEPAELVEEPFDCAHEGQACACNGTVVYGRRLVANNHDRPATLAEMMQDSHVVREGVAGNIQCANDVLGDPLPGVGKKCVCAPAGLPAEAEGEPSADVVDEQASRVKGARKLMGF